MRAQPTAQDEPPPAVELLAPDAPLHVVLNPAAADGADAGLRAALVEAWASSRRRLHWYPAGPGRLDAVAEAGAASATRSGGVLVAVGGDGTASTVARFAMRAGVPFGLVPAGTFNVFARQHGIPLDPRAAAQALLVPVVRRVQVGRAAGLPFLVNASLGLYPDLLEARERDSQRFGRHPAVALLSGLAHALRRRRRLRLVLDDGSQVRNLEASLLFVGNSALQLAPLGLAPGVLPAPGCMAALALPPARAVAWFGLLWQAAWGRLGAAGEVLQFNLRTLTVHRRSRQRGLFKLALDGEVHRVRGPIEFGVEPAALRLAGQRGP